MADKQNITDYAILGDYLDNVQKQHGGKATWVDIASNEEMRTLFAKYGVTDYKTLVANNDIKDAYKKSRTVLPVTFDTGDTKSDELPIPYQKDIVPKVGRTEKPGVSPEGWTAKDIYTGGLFGEKVPESPKQTKAPLRQIGSAESNYNPTVAPYIIPEGKTLEDMNEQQHRIQKEQVAWEFNQKGGMMIRTLDVPLQYMKAGILYARGDKLPADYSWFDPIKRVSYPNEGYYVDMRAITGLDWDTSIGAAVNLSAEFILDPINHIGGWETQASKAIKITRGLADIAPETEKVLAKSGEIFKAARKAKTLETIVPHLKNIPLANRGKNVNKIIGGIKDVPLSDTRSYINAAKNLDAQDVEKASASLRRYYSKNVPDMLPVYDAAISVAEGKSGKGKALFSLYEMLDDMRAIGTGPDKVLAFLGHADDYDDLLYRYRLLGVKDPFQSKDLAYILKQAKKNPKQINQLFQEYTLLSDQIRQGHVGYGLGLYSGWGREGQLNLLKPKVVRETMGGILQTVESLYNKARYLDANARLIPEVVSIKDGAAVSRGLRNFEKTIERMQYGWEAEVIKRTSQSKVLRKEVLLNQLTAMGIDGKDVLRGIEGLPTSQQNEAIGDLGDVVKNMLAEGYTTEAGFRDYGALEGYLPRVTELNSRSQGAMDHLINYYGSKSRLNVAKLGLEYVPEYEKALRKFSNVNMTVGNMAQVARSEEAPKLARELAGKFTEFATIAKDQGKLELSAQFLKDRKFFDDMIGLYELKQAPNERELGVLKRALDSGRLSQENYDLATQGGLSTFHKYLGPMEFNERTRSTLGKYIEPYLQSKNARRYGYEKGATLRDFKVWSEDLEAILAERMHKTAGSSAAGEYLGRYVKEFDIPLGKSKSSKEVWDAAQVLARENNSEIVNLHEFIEKGTVDIHGRPVKYPNANWLLGNVGKGVHMDKTMAKGLLRVAGAQEIMDSGSIFNKAHSKYMQWWARSTLFGGRTTYLYNNAAGDTWKQFVIGVDTWHMSGMPSWQVILPEGKTFGGIGAAQSKFAPVGLADNIPYKYNPLTGKWATVKNVRDELMEMKILGGQYASTTFEEAGRHLSDEITPWGHAIKRFWNDKSMQNLGKLAKSIPETVVYSVVRGEFAPIRRAAKHIEDVKRAGTYMYFRYERGYSKIDAQSMVYKVHYDYEKQNSIIKSWVPFYYWNVKNIPQEFSNAFIKPGKYASLGKVVKAPWDEMFGFESYPEKADSEWNRGAGVRVGDVNGIPLMANFSQIPPFAAQDLTGILNSNDRYEGFIQALKAMGGMTEPFIQVAAEQIANEEFFTGKPIASGGKGAVPERGIREFMGIDIQDKPWAQRMVHISESFVTPLGVVRSAIATIDKMPQPAYTAKLLMGIPLGLSNPVSQEYLSMNEQIHVVDGKIRHIESFIDPYGDADQQAALQEQAANLSAYKSFLTTQANQINELLEQTATLNKMAKQAEKHQDFGVQAELEGAIKELMEGYREQAWNRDIQRKEVMKEFKQYIQ